nr:unnamed protein product [Callosobruchus analis]
MKGVVVFSLVLLLNRHVGADSVSKNGISDEGELITVVVAYRHGDRAPTKPIPTNKYCNASYWPMGFGQLTKFGIERHYKLGQWLRKRYNSLLSPIYDLNEIYVRSTDKERTLMSAYANLAGLYPPQIDNVVMEERPCPLYDFLLNDIIKSDYFTKINDKYADLYKTLSNWTGIDVKDVKDIKEIRSTLYAIKNYNTTYTMTPSMKRLRAGPFFHYLFKHLDHSVSASETKPAPKMLMISMHDTSLSGILNSMGVFDGRPPDFAATVLWELRKRQNGKHFVNLYFKSEAELEKLKIMECGFDCDYEDFKMFMKHTVVITMIGVIVFAIILFINGDIEAAGAEKDNVKAEELVTLVALGIQREYKLGQWLRQRYSSLLSPIYSKSELVVRSTDKDRALMSAYASLAGLYPPQGYQVWNENLAWQPIPVHTIPREIDDVIVEKRNCPKYSALLNDTINSDFFISVNEENADFYKNLSDWTKLDVKDVEDVKLIKSTLTSMKNYNTSYLPYWEKFIDWDLLDYLTGLMYKRYTTTLTMKRLMSGPFFHYLFDHMDSAISSNQSSSVPKMLMLSAHGTSLSIILKKCLAQHHSRY